MNTTYFMNQVMGNVFKSKTSPALPTAYWLGFSKTAPTVSGTGASEPGTAGTGYARVNITSSFTARWKRAACARRTRFFPSGPTSFPSSLPMRRAERGQTG